MLSPETREQGPGTAEFEPPCGPVTKTTVRTESGPGPREVPPRPRPGGSCSGRRHPLPSTSPLPPRGPGGGWYTRTPPGCELLSVRLLSGVQQSGGCEPRSADWLGPARGFLPESGPESPQLPPTEFSDTTGSRSCWVPESGSNARAEPCRRPLARTTGEARWEASSR